MPRVEVQSYCQSCQRNTLHAKEEMRVSHAAHLLGVIFLCGLWLPIWLLQCWDVDRRNKATPYRCQVCGEGVEIEGPSQVIYSVIGLVAVLVFVCVLWYLVSQY